MTFDNTTTTTTNTTTIQSPDQTKAAISSGSNGLRDYDEAREEGQNRILAKNEAHDLGAGDDRADSDDVESSSFTCDSSSSNLTDTNATTTIFTTTTTPPNHNSLEQTRNYADVKFSTSTTSRASQHQIEQLSLSDGSPPSFSQGDEASRATSDASRNSQNNLVGTCYNHVLDDEIRCRLDKLNALSDLINSLERQFDEANSVFRETLKCSTDKLSSIAKALGSKSIRQGRIYRAAKLSVEQSQSDCQKACVQFERANRDHQFAKQAIQDAELKLKESAGETATGVIAIPNVTECIDFSKLTLNGISQLSEEVESSAQICDKQVSQPSPSSSSTTPPYSEIANQPNGLEANAVDKDHSSAPIQVQRYVDCHQNTNEVPSKDASSPTITVKNTAKLSEELNQAILKLIEAEKKRGVSERQHLDQANKLMVAQENLVKLEREFGPSIRRSQFYFEEAKRFNAKLSSVKGEIFKISDEIIAAKQSYAQTLKELEQFSDDLHDSSQISSSS